MSRPIAIHLAHIPVARVFCHTIGVAVLLAGQWQRIEDGLVKADIDHISVGIGDMASRAFADRLGLCRSEVGRRRMVEVEIAPVVAFLEPLAVLDGNIESIDSTGEVATS